MQPWDEMYDEAGEVRAGREGLAAALAALGPDGLVARARLRDAHLSAQGITFSLSGRERPFPLDLVPRIIDAAEWQVIEAGVAQRVRALEMFLDDVYGAGEILRDGVIPRRLVTSSEHFHREAAGIVPGQRRAHPRRRHRPGPRRRGRRSGCWRTTCAPRRASPT